MRAVGGCINQVIELAEVLADSASFVSACEIAEALASLGYDIAPLGDAPTEGRLNRRCATALLHLALAQRLVGH